MIRALYSAASGMNAQQTNIDNIANNLANSSTNGFKMRRAQFQDLMYQSLVQPGAAAGAQTIVPSGLQIGLGTRTASNEIIFSQGNFQETDNPLDMAIQGNGFFQVLQPTGQLAYTRDGGFQLDQQRQSGDLERQSCSAADHNTVAGAKYHDRRRWHSHLYPARANCLHGSRTDSARLVPQPGRSEQHRSEPVRTDRCVRECHGRAIPAGRKVWAALMQGYVEGSNVSVVEEFVNMIVSQRAYEANSKVVKAADEMYQQINNVTQ